MGSPRSAATAARSAVDGHVGWSGPKIASPIATARSYCTLAPASSPSSRSTRPRVSQRQATSTACGPRAASVTASARPARHHRRQRLCLQRHSQLLQHLPAPRSSGSAPAGWSPQLRRRETAAPRPRRYQPAVRSCSPRSVGTGQRRRTGATYGAQGDDRVIIASDGGRPRHPSWYLNLLATPHVEVQVGAETDRELGLMLANEVR